MITENRTYIDDDDIEYPYELDISRNHRELLTFTVHYNGKSLGDGKEYEDLDSLYVMADFIFLRLRDSFNS